MVPSSVVSYLVSRRPDETIPSQSLHSLKPFPQTFTRVETTPLFVVFDRPPRRTLLMKTHYSTPLRRRPSVVDENLYRKGVPSGPLLGPPSREMSSVPLVGHVRCRRLWVRTGSMCPAGAGHSVTASYPCDGAANKSFRGRTHRTQTPHPSWETRNSFTSTNPFTHLQSYSGNPSCRRSRTHSSRVVS